MKLSRRGRELLALVNERSTWEGDERPGRVLTSYFIPRPIASDPSGPGDAAAFRGLVARGYIKRRGAAPYAYVITEDGILALENGS